MVTLVAIGTFFLATSPSTSIILVILRRNPHLIVISIVAAFAWSIALTLSGTVYWMIPPLRDVYPWLLFVAVFMQELMRLLMYELFRFMFKSGDGVQGFIRPGIKNDALTGLSVGVGFGFMSVLVNFYSAVIDEFKDETAIYTDRCGINFFVAASLYALSFSLLHIFLGIFVWPAYADRNMLYICGGFLMHLGLSEATLANRRAEGCRWGIGLSYGLLLVVCIFTLYALRNRVNKENA